MDSAQTDRIFRQTSVPEWRRLLCLSLLIGLASQLGHGQTTTPTAGGAGQTETLLTDVAAIRNLSPRELRQRLPIRIEGRITIAMRARNVIVVQVGDQGLSVFDSAKRSDLAIGQKVRLEG